MAQSLQHRNYMHLISNEPHGEKGLFDSLRRKKCSWCNSEHLRPVFVIEQETRPLKEYWHTIIARCGDCKRGQLERAYSDSSDWETTFDQTEWYLLEETSMKQLCDFIEQNATPVVLRLAPCPQPLSPKCLCEVHWQLTEAAKRLEPLTDDEMRKCGGFIETTFCLTPAGLPEFETSS